MKLRYRGDLRKTLVDVAVVEYDKVVEVTEELGRNLLQRFAHEWERVEEEVRGRKKARQEDAPPEAPPDAARGKGPEPDPEPAQEEEVVEVSGTDH